MGMSMVNLDQIYPNLVQTASSSFGYLTSSSSTPADVANYITNVRQNYQPWYTAIQTNIDSAKASVNSNLTAGFNGLQGIPDKVESSYNQMVKVFTGRGCSQYSQYLTNVTNKLTMSISSIMSTLSSFQMSVQSSIPQDLISPFSSQLSMSLYSSTSNVPVLTLIKQVRIIFFCCKFNLLMIFSRTD